MAVGSTADSRIRVIVPGKGLERAGLVALLGSALYLALGVVWDGRPHVLDVPSYDVYGYIYPTFLYAWRSLHERGGLLWNPYQDCGQPFFANSQSALLYPPNLLFGILDREPAFITTLVLHLCIGGAGMYLLGREHRLRVPAALCGALAFQLGWAAVTLGSWTPLHIAAYAWLAVAMWLTERVVRAPTSSRALALGVALTFQLLVGFPQILFFTYQLIGLRVGWALLTRRTPRPASLLRATAVAAVLPLGLGAVQILPAIEVARASLRSLPVGPREIGQSFSWAALSANLRSYAGIPGNLVVIVLATAAFARRERRVEALYYLVVATVYFVLSLGAGTPLFAIYARLPLGSAFRGAARLLWVTGFAVAALVGFGADAILRPDASPAVKPRAVRAATLLTAGIVVALLSSRGARWTDVLLVAAVLVVTLVPGGRHGTHAAAFVIAAVVFASCALVGMPPFFTPRAGDLYFRHADAFAALRSRMTAADRAVLLGPFQDLSLMPKSGSIFRVPTIYDYEPQASLSYAEFFTYMRTGHPLSQLDDWYWINEHLMPSTLQRRLFDLTAARYIMVDREVDRVTDVLAGGVSLASDDGRVRIYENLQALPRAYYVPRIAVTPEERILPLLADGSVDARRVALVPHPPRSGFVGAKADGSGSTDVVGNASERVVLRVHATAPGFVFLADEDFPGWTANVNGTPAEILRANYTFRLVEVPAGESEVTFTYRPLSVRLGALTSLLTAGIAVVLWCRARRRLRRPTR